MLEVRTELLPDGVGTVVKVEVSGVVDASVVTLTVYVEPNESLPLLDQLFRSAPSAPSTVSPLPDVTLTAVIVFLSTLSEIGVVGAIWVALAAGFTVSLGPAGDGEAETALSDASPLLPPPPLEQAAAARAVASRTTNSAIRRGARLETLRRPAGVVGRAGGVAAADGRAWVVTSNSGKSGAPGAARGG